MTTLQNDGSRAGAFIVSEGNHTISREVGTLASGQKLVDGTLLRMSGGKLVGVESGDVSSEGVADFEGILYGHWDASATGTNADITDVPYVARLAEVDDKELTYPEESTAGGEKAACVAAMAAKNIFPR